MIKLEIFKVLAEMFENLGKSLNIFNPKSVNFKRNYISNDNEALKEDWDNVGKLLSQYIGK